MFLLAEPYGHRFHRTRPILALPSAERPAVPPPKAEVNIGAENNDENGDANASDVDEPLPALEPLGNIFFPYLFFPFLPFV